MLLATDIFTLIDEDVVQPIDDFVKTPEDKAWLAGFMPAYMASAKVDGRFWARHSSARPRSSIGTRRPSRKPDSIRRSTEDLG